MLTDQDLNDLKSLLYLWRPSGAHRPAAEVLVGRACRSGPQKIAGRREGDELCEGVEARIGVFYVAIRALKEWHEGSHTLYGDPVPASESSLEKAWPEFKPAAHFWAAWCVWEEKHQEKVFLHDPHRVPDFLALTDSFAREAERHDLLSSSETWRIPEDLTLPDVRLLIEPLSKSQLEKLSRIRR